MVSEKAFQDRVLPQLRKLPGSWWVKIQRAQGGTPDIIGCLRRLFVSIELKKGPKAPIGKLQVYTLEQISKAGGLTMVVDPTNWEAAYSHLQYLATRKHR